MAEQTVQISIKATGADKAAQGLKSVGDAADQAAGKVGDFEESAGAAGSAMDALGGAAAAGAVLKIGQVANAAAAAASDLNETTAAVGELYGTATPQLEEWAARGARAFGQSATGALQAAQTFGVFGKAAGLADDELLDFGQSMTELASDMASFYNTSPEDAVLALGAALRGEMEPIRRYGVLLDQASLEAEAVSSGLMAAGATMTQQQKVLAAQALILKQTTTAQGDFARTSDGLANSQRIQAAEAANLTAQIGQNLLPAWEGVTKAANGALGVFQSITANPLGSSLLVMAAGVMTVRVAFAALSTVAKTSVFSSMAATLSASSLSLTSLADRAAAAGGKLALLRTAATSMGSAVLKAGRGLMALTGGPVVVGLTAIAAGIAAVHKQAEASRQQVEALAEALKSAGSESARSKVLMDQVTTAIEGLESGGLKGAAVLEKAGVSVYEFTSAVRAGGAPLDALTAKLQGVADSNRYFFQGSSDPRSGMKAVTDQYNAMGDAALVALGAVQNQSSTISQAIGAWSSFGETQEQVAGALGATSDAQVEAAEASTVAEVKMADAATAGEALALAYSAAAGQAVVYTGSTDSVIGATTDAATQLDALAAAVAELTGEDEKGLGRLSKAITGAGVGSRDFAKAMNGLSGDALKVFDSLGNLGGALNEQVVAQAAAGASAGELKGSLRDARVAFVQQAQSMGLTKDAARLLADQYGLTGKNAEALKDSLDKAATEGGDAWERGMEKFEASSRDTMTEVEKTTADGGRAAGVAGGKAVASGLTSTASGATAAGQKVGVAAKSGVAKGVAGVGGEGSAAGRDFGSGFANGISGQQAKISGAAHAAGAAAVDALRAEIDAHSDSRKTIAAGLDFAGGFSTGITEGEPKVKSSAKRIGTAATVTLEDQIGSGAATVGLSLSDWISRRGATSTPLDMGGALARLTAGWAPAMTQLTAAPTPRDYTPSYEAGYRASSTTQIGSLVTVQSMSVRSDADVQAVSDALWARAQAAARGQGLRAYAGVI